MRRLSPQEIGLAMDLHVGVLKAQNIVSRIDPLVLTNLVDVPPLEITQADSAHLFLLI